MTAELGQTRDPAVLIPGDVGALHRIATVWRARGEQSEDVGSTLHTMRSVPDWTGEASDAYETRVATVASGWSAMAEALRRGQAALEDVAAALGAARGRAGDAIDLWDRADAMDAAALLIPSAESSNFSDVGRRAFAGSTQRAEARAILGDARSSVRDAAQQAAAALRAAMATRDLGADEWAALLTGCANPAQVLDALAGADASSLAMLLKARPSLAVILSQADPSEVAPWWKELDEAQKDALIESAPAVIGNLGGVAYSARDEANRIWLSTQLDEARAALAKAEKGRSVHEVLAGQYGEQEYAERLERARTRVKALENIESTLEAPSDAASRHLISLTADTPPLAAISIGDLDTADDITYAVPGMGTTTTGMGEWARAAQNIVDTQDFVDPERTHAVVAWIGYETPSNPLVTGGFDVMQTDMAETGAANLSRDLSALELMRPIAQVGIVAHSYGTATASIALAQGGVHVDSFVTLGSAGLPTNIDSASDLNADEVFSGQAQDVLAIDPAEGDQWAWAGRISPEHRVNPMNPSFDSHAFNVSGADGRLPVTDHGVLTANGTGYLDSRTESLRNVALATTGHGERVSPYVKPDPTPFQRALTEGTRYDFLY